MCLHLWEWLIHLCSASNINGKSTGRESTQEGSPRNTTPYRDSYDYDWTTMQTLMTKSVWFCQGSVPICKQIVTALQTFNVSFQSQIPYGLVCISTPRTSFWQTPLFSRTLLGALLSWGSAKTLLLSSEMLYISSHSPYWLVTLRVWDKHNSLESETWLVEMWEGSNSSCRW